MSTEAMTADRWRLAHRCLVALADGPFVEEWEFETLVGYTREELRALAETNLESEYGASLAIIDTALAQLLGYPHGLADRLEAIVGATRQELVEFQSAIRALREQPAQ